MRRKELLFAVIGGIVGALVMMALGFGVSLSAQSGGDANFGKITCTELEVLYSNGLRRVRIAGDEHGGEIEICGRSGNRRIHFDGWLHGGVIAIRGRNKDKVTSIRPGFIFLQSGEEWPHITIDTVSGIRINRGVLQDLVELGVDEKSGAGYVRVSDKAFRQRAGMSVGEHGGEVRVFGQDGKPRASMVADEYGGVIAVLENFSPSAAMYSGEVGGAVFVYDKNNTSASISVGEDGGEVAVNGKDGTQQTRIHTTENGGRVDVFGKGSSKSRAAMGVNEYGNGVVKTWDKNGYSLK